MLMRTLQAGEMLILIRDRVVIGRIFHADTTRFRIGLDLDHSIDIFPERWFPTGTPLHLGARIPDHVSLDRAVMARAAAVHQPQPRLVSPRQS